jgi:hypothetical protein
VEELPLAGLPRPPQSPHPLPHQQLSAILQLLLLLPQQQHHQQLLKLRLPPELKDLVSSDRWPLPLREFAQLRLQKCHLVLPSLNLLQHILTPSQRCRCRILYRPRSRRLVQRRLVRPRRSHAPEHGIRTAAPEHGTNAVDRRVCDRRQQLPQVHGRESGQPDHLRMVPGSAQGMPGRGWPVLEQGGVNTLHMHEFKKRVHLDRRMYNTTIA